MSAPTYCSTPTLNTPRRHRHPPADITWASRWHSTAQYRTVPHSTAQQQHNHNSTTTAQHTACTVPSQLSTAACRHHIMAASSTMPPSVCSDSTRACLSTICQRQWPIYPAQATTNILLSPGRLLNAPISCPNDDVGYRRAQPVDLTLRSSPCH